MLISPIRLDFLGKRFFDDFQIVFHTLLIHIRVVAVFDELLTELVKEIVPVFDFIVFDVSLNPNWMAAI